MTALLSGAVTSARRPEVIGGAFPECPPFGGHGVGKIGTTGASMSVVHTQDDDRGIAGAHVDKSGFQTNDTAAKS
ncbi:MAG: hypothetical protein KDB71_07315 [Mycobacterium sp.]|nr:hypothetical protein [Mycobacterium sp.]